MDLQQAIEPQDTPSQVLERFVPSSIFDGLDISTPYIHAKDDDGEPDHRQHVLFQTLTANTIDDVAPWLREVIAVTGARIVSWQGCCLLGIPQAAGGFHWVNVTTVSERLNLLPWQEDWQPTQ